MNNQEITDIDDKLYDLICSYLDLDNNNIDVTGELYFEARDKVINCIKMLRKEGAGDE